MKLPQVKKQYTLLCKDFNFFADFLPLFLNAVMHLRSAELIARLKLSLRMWIYKHEFCNGTVDLGGG